MTMTGARSGVFDDSQAQTLLESDSDHWWFNNKGAIVAGLIQGHVAGAGHDGWLVDLGAGAGGVTARLGWTPSRTVALDGFRPSVRAGRDRHELRGLVGTVNAVPLAEGVAHAVTLLDVIEHLDDPQPALDEARRILAPGGVLVVTVPAHQWLWSRADELLGHVKRYNRRLLRSELERGGFEVIRCGHVFSWLVPAVWVRRRVATSPEQQLGLDAGSAGLARVAGALTKLERRVTRRVSLPLGTTVVAVARLPA